MKTEIPEEKKYLWQLTIDEFRDLHQELMKLVRLILRALHNFFQACFFSFCNRMKILVSFISAISQIEKFSLFLTGQSWGSQEKLSLCFVFRRS